MTSYPLIQASLSRTERDFIRFVERRVGASDALYQAERASGLPGDTVRMSTQANDAADISERRHRVEFMSLSGDGYWETVGCVGHSLKEIEAMQGRYVEMESRFEIVGPGVRPGRFARAEVERVVQAQLDKLKAARLLPLASRRAPRDLAVRPEHVVQLGEPS
jgi:hypothetical protein